MDAAAKTLIDSVKDIARRVFSEGSGPPKYDHLYEGYARLALQPGSAVFIIAPNGAELLFHWIAALANGYVPCVLAPSMKTPFVAALRESLNVSAIVGPRLDPAKYRVANAVEIGTFNAIVCDRKPPPYEPFDVLVLTTGTSGSQTACVHTVRSLMCNASMTNAALGITAADRQLVVLPMYHTYGLVTQSIGSIVGGCELVIDGPPFNANRFAEVLRRERISVCGITPTIARELLARGTALPHVRALSIGGDRVTVEEVTSLIGKSFVDELYITYGLTEAGPRVSLLPAHLASAEVYDSVGRAFSAVSTRIEMPDADGVGQLLVKTPSCCRRKVGRGIERQPFTSDGYLETGDLFAEDAAGHLRYFGRKAEILTIKGEKVNSRSIDRVAALHPDVEFARTTSGKTDSLVLRLWAKDGKTLDLDGVKRFMGSHLRLHEIPEWFVQEGADVFHK